MEDGIEDSDVKLARIEEKVDGLRWLIEKQNGRLDDAEDDITSLRVRDGYVAGFAAAVAAIAATVMAWLTGGR